MRVRASPEMIAVLQAKAAELEAVAAQNRAKVAALRGVAGLACLTGLAAVIYAGCVGYARTQTPIVEAAKTFLAAMQKPVKVEVTAKLADGSEVALKDGAKVALKSGAVVGLADGQQVTLAKGGIVDVSPNSTVRAVVDMPRPSQIQADAKPASGAPVKTDVVVFKMASYGGKGEVVTGWRFSSSTEDKPVAQWCLYREPQLDGTLRSVTIGEDGQRVGLPNPSPFPGVDLQATFASCVWANGAATTARAPVNRDDRPPSPPHVITARAKG